MQALCDLIEFNIALLLSGFAALAVAWLLLWVEFREMNKRVKELHAHDLAVMMRSEAAISAARKQAKKF